MKALTDEIDHIFTTRKIPAENLSGQLTGTASIHIDRTRSMADLNNLFGAMQESYSAIIEHCIQTHAYYLSMRGHGVDDLDRYYTALNRYRVLKLTDLGVKKIAFSGHGVMEVSGMDVIVRYIEKSVSSLYSITSEPINLEQQKNALHQLRQNMKLSNEASHRVELAEQSIIELFR